MTDIGSGGTPPHIPNSKRRDRLGWLRTIAIGMSVVFVVQLLYAIWLNFARPTTGDFISFWAAGRLSSLGHASASYDLAMHRAVELSVAHVAGINPFPYPPPYLLLVTPFAFYPFWLAFGAWVAANAAFYLVATRRLLPLPWSLIHPAAHLNILIGQNGLLTTSLFVVGTRQLAPRPILAGAILGALIIKPQLCLLIPFALIAGRHWRAIFAAAASSAFLLIVSAIIFGVRSYEAFVAILPHYAGFMENGSWPWGRLISMFAFVRALGAGQGTALVTQAIVAVGAIIVTWRAWSRGLDQRVAILAAASLLMPPYLFNYDSLLLIVPIARFLQARQYCSIGFVWLCCVLPLANYGGIYSGPNTIPLAALFCIWVLHKEDADGSNNDNIEPAGAGLPTDALATSSRAAP